MPITFQGLKGKWNLMKDDLINFKFAPGKELAGIVLEVRESKVLVKIKAGGSGTGLMWVKAKSIISALASPENTLVVEED